MIQIKINNEEVVSDKDIVIKEEMLNTSSVILNNVYPKSWEEDKDYVSRFYYPKDYSKCLINDVTPTEFTIDGETIQNTGLLPSEYTQAEYIQSGSIPHIDTGVIPTSDTKIDIDFAYVSSTYSGWSPLFGERGSSNSMYFAFFINTSGLKVSPNYAGFDPGNNSQVTLTANTRYNLKNEAGQFYLNDEVESSISTSNTLTTSNKSIWLFDLQQNSGAGMSRQMTARIYRCRFYEGEELIRDFIPCVRNSDNEIGMYDVVNDVFYTNQGTGSFTYGKMPSPSSPIPLVSKTGIVTQTIDGKEYEFNLGDIELSEVGNYKDEIMKPTGKNIFSLNDYNNNYSSTEYSSFGNLLEIKSRYGIIASIVASSNSYKITTVNAYDMSQVWKLTNLKPNTEYTIGYNLLTNKTSGTIRLFEVNVNYNTIKSSTTFTTDSNGEKEFNLMFYGLNGANNNYCELSNIQLEIGTLTDYEPYGLDKDKWYLKKEVRHTTLNVSDMNNSENYPGWKSLETIYQDYPKQNAVLNGLTSVMCNISEEGTGIAINTNGSAVGTIFLQRAQFNELTQTQWIEQYPELEFDLLYGLKAPIYTEITNTTLLKQLNNVGVDLLFAGVVKNTGEISLNPRDPHYCSVQVLDFKDFLSQGETLDFVINNKTVLEAIQQVVGTIAPYGFVLGEVQILNPDDIIGAYSTKDETAYDVFNYLADISQARWTTRMIDENTVAIDFYDPTLLPEGEGIEYTKEWFCENNIDDMSFSYSSNDYRNKQVMLSGEVYSNIETTEIIVADGYQTQFNTTDKIGSITELLVNGSAQTVITKDEYDLGYDCDFYYTPGNNYFESVDLVSTGAVITITYYAIIEGREVVLNQNEISRIAEMIDRKGVIARYENRNDATTTKELQAIGQTYLKYKGMPEVKLNVISRSNLWNIGDRVNFNAPIDELDQEYMVKSKSIQRIATVDKIFYTFELTSSFNMEQDVNYFDNQRYKAKGNIADGDFISRNIDIENTANIVFYDLEVTEVEVEGTSALQSELQTPLGVE